MKGERGRGVGNRDEGRERRRVIEIKGEERVREQWGGREDKRRFKGFKAKD